MKNILIIEDDKDLCKLISQVLKYEGYTPHTAFSGGEGLRVFSAQKIDLVILDIILPDIDGLEILEIIKKSRVPVIVCTEKGLMSDVEKAISLGADWYIVKPFKVEKLLNKIKELI